MDYIVTIHWPGLGGGRPGNTSHTKFMFYRNAHTVARALKDRYTYAGGRWDYEVLGVDIFEDTPERRLVGSKKQGNVNFSWR